ncbi:MAG TPA: chromate efflux transporter [Thermomicrobiales bacterium]|nr:chromate efflux transporter [Thermomicrobiales bacterium]
MDHPPSVIERASLRDLALVSLKLGFTAFGGPAAHIAMLHDETVVRRRWTTEQHFLDMLGVTNLIPGPNSTEMVIHTGYEHRGWRGLLVAGWLFILPAASIVLVLAWLYVRYGTTPEGTWLLYGIKPVIIAVVAQALWNLGRTAIKGALLGAIAAVVLGLYLLGIKELALLFGGGFIAVAALGARRIPRNDGLALVAMPLGSMKLPVLATIAADATVPYSPLRLFLTFLKIGSVLYGSGYVLLAFLRGDFVERLGWLTERQLLDALAIGQVTPGPVFTTATFVGYLVGGVPGAVLATLGIFIPAFVLVAAVNPLVPRLRSSPWMGAFLDGVNVAAIGLMAAVTLELGQAALVDWLTVALAAVAAVLLIRYRINSAWLVVVGALIGLLAREFGGVIGIGPA